MQPAIAAKSQDPRQQIRSSVFLSAVLAHKGGSKPVRVRNISVTGALLDGTNLPLEGAAVQLRRGNLCAAGEVAWQGRDNCGIRFNEPIDLEPWVSRVGHAGQRRVDNILATLRAGDVPDDAVEENGGAALKNISAELTAISEDLGNLPDSKLELAEWVLRLDAIAQRLRNLVANAE